MPPYNDFCISRGARHVAVRSLQAALNDQGATPKLAVDGDFGRFTEAALIRLQLREPSLNYTIGGVAGPKEFAFLGLLQEMRKYPLIHVGDNDWKDALGFESVMVGNNVVDPKTGQMVPTIGKGMRLSGYKTLIGGRMEHPDKVWIYHGPLDPDRGTIIHNECALLPQSFDPRVGGTSTWRRGPHLRALAKTMPNDEPLLGLVVATLHDGWYYNDHSGRSHTGIFDGWIRRGGKIVGFYMVEQSNTVDIHRGEKMFYDHYDRDEMIAKKYPGKDDFTVPVYDDNGQLIAFTVIHDKLYSLYKYNWIGIGDEYYAVYSNGQTLVS